MLWLRLARWLAAELSSLRQRGVACQVLSIVALVCSIIPYVLILLVPIVVAFAVLRRYYLMTSREVSQSSAHFPSICGLALLSLTPASLSWCWLCVSGEASGSHQPQPCALARRVVARRCFVLYASRIGSACVLNSILWCAAGLTTIRGFGAERFFVREFETKLDDNTRSDLLLRCLLDTLHSLSC